MSQPIFTFTESTHILEVWFVSHDEREAVEDRMDWMAIIYREPDEGWYLKYRFRYHTGGTEPHANDQKNSYVAGPMAEINGRQLETVDLVARGIADRHQTEVDYVRINGGVDTFFEKCRDLSWFHYSVEPVATSENDPNSRSAKRRRERQRQKESKRKK